MQKLSLTKKYQTYPKYKDSGIEWVGDVPEGWDVATSRRLFQTKKQLASETESQTVLSLTLQGVIPRVLDGSGKNPANYDTYQEFQKDDLVFCLFDYDVTPRTIGYVGENGIMTGAYTRLIPKSETSSKFFYYYFLYLDYTKELLHLCTGLRNSISKPVFWSLKNPLPSKEEQEKIARFLDEQTARIDETIAKKERLIELLKEKRIATINTAVTRGLSTNNNLVDSSVRWIGKIPENWNTSALKTLLISKITDGPHTTPALYDDGVEFISAESIQANNTINFSKRRGFISQEDHKEYCKKACPQRDDIFMVKSGATTGRVAIVDTDKEFSIWSPLALMRTDSKKANAKFIYYFLQSSLFQDQVRVSWSYGTQQNIGMRVIENLQIVYPDIAEQKNIADSLDRKMPAYDCAIEKVEISIMKLQELKSSLISHAVTGKIKV